MSSKYIDEFLHCKCASTLLDNKLFPNTKEITETFGAYNAVRKHLCYEFGDKTISVICVGDGFKPRTAATFALRSNWTAHSVDPKLRPRQYKIRRLILHKNRIENIIIRCKTAILVCVHSHASLYNSVKSILCDKLSIINIPCCVDNDLPIKPDIVYQDKSILSPKNTVEIYKNLRIPQ